VEFSNGPTCCKAPTTIVKCAAPMSSTTIWNPDKRVSPGASVVTLSLPTTLSWCTSQVPSTAMMRLRNTRDLSSNAPTTRLEMHMKLIFLRGYACELRQPSAWHPPRWVSEDPCDKEAD
jgi:hypothetical protein